MFFTDRHRHTYVSQTEVMRHQVLMVAQRDLQQLFSTSYSSSNSTSRVERQPVIMFRDLLLFNAHGMNVISHASHHPSYATSTTHASSTQPSSSTVRRVPLLLQDHLVGLQISHNSLTGQPGEASNRGQVTEHEHARTEAWLHATVRAEELIAKFVLDQAHVEEARLRVLSHWRWSWKRGQRGSASMQGHLTHPKDIKREQIMMWHSLHTWSAHNQGRTQVFINKSQNVDW